MQIKRTERQPADKTKTTRTYQHSIKLQKKSILNVKLYSVSSNNTIHQMLAILFVSKNA